MFKLLIKQRLFKAAPQLLPGVLLQAYLVARLLTEPLQTVSSAWIIFMLLLQALAALLALPAAFILLPRRFKHRLWLTGLFLWCYLFAVPIGGVLLTCIAMALATKLPRTVVGLPIFLIDAPSFLAPHAIAAVGRGAHLKSVLQSPAAASSSRMNALMAMQSMPMHTVSSLLRTMLDDPFEDIRLLAFWMLDRKEKALTQKILEQLPRLKQALTPLEHYRVNKELALLYNELVYASLVQGDVYRHAMREAERYLLEALAWLPNDAALWRLLACLALDRRDTLQASAMLDQAIEYGFDRQRLLPYLAEIAYLNKDYQTVRTLLAAQPIASARPVMQPVLRYWGGK